jgi:hypothetical protein|uniref:Uncharacterized protein n=1 Tax=viral metagenome TaxID=1070528 RepID=A0A6C0DZE1_9ZZZZ
MSYSYLKNVFPNFDSSVDYQNKVYNEININTTNQTNSTVTPASNIPSLNKLSKFTQSLIGAPFQQNNMPIMSKEPYVETTQESFSNNTIEKFEDEQPTCDFYMKHVLSCHRCRSIIMKQWNIDNNRIQNEEIMELVTYIVFGIFILLLIDILKNK